MGKMKIFAGSASLELAKKVSKHSKIKLGGYHVNQFNDGEFQPEVEENVRGRNVYLIQSGHPPFDNYWELFQMIDGLRRASANKIVVVIPYMGYSRQDRKDKSRIGIASRLISKFLESAGSDRLVTFDWHSEQIGGFYNIPVDQLFASTVFIPYIKSLNLNDLVVAAPDAGSTKRTLQYAKALNCHMVVCDKHRKKAGEVGDMFLLGDVKDKNVIITDDLIDSGGTLISAANLLMEKGALSVRAVATHPVFSKNAIQKLQNSVLSEIIVSDTIPIRLKETETMDKITIISISELLANAMLRIHKNKSVSKLFKYS